jgi:co-chaperonin GroES (HSP10)
MMALQRQVLSVLAVVLCLALHVNALAGAPSRKFNGGAGMGRLVIDDLTGAQDAVSCHYDMVLVERIQGNPKKESGLFVPDADLPRLHLCRVLSMGTGAEEENGTISPMPDIKIGDVVIAKNPWGIGPKDEETTSGKKLSFMRSQDIAAVITGGLTEESAKDTL